VSCEYQNRFRDGSDGRQIYQIDVRTSPVLKVYSMTR
jgi:hypothetical protein